MKLVHFHVHDLQNDKTIVTASRYVRTPTMYVFYVGNRVVGKFRADDVISVEDTSQGAEGNGRNKPTSL